MFIENLIIIKMKKQQRQGNLLKRMLVVITLSLTLTSLIQAQTKVVTGVVKEASGETIIAASVMVKSTTIGTVTNIDGEFKLDVPVNAKTLIVSYIGMRTEEVAITGSNLTIILQDDLKMLEDVVVIGYGTQRKRDLTGSVSSVGEKALKDIPVSTVAEALTGKLSGVQVTTTEGSPDAEIKIRVRGGGSITQSNSPLYIVDGFAKDDIKDIAPSEIVSIDVLKDASSTAIYGSRGANGVIIITTKSGSQGKMSVTYSGYVGFKKLTKTLDVLTPYEFVQKQYERAVWGGSEKVTSEYEKYFGDFGDIDLYNYMKGTDWQTETFGRTGFSQNHTLTLSGGTSKFKYNASLGHIDDKAIMAMSNYSRNNLSLKLNYQPIKWLKLDLSTRYAGTKVLGSGANDQSGSEKSTTDSRVKNAVVYTPIALKNMVSQDDDSEALANLYSPLQMTADNDRKQLNTDFSVNGGFSIDFNKNLSFKSTLGLTNAYRDDNKFYGLSTYYVREGGALKRDNKQAPAILLTDTKNTTLQNTNVLNFNKKDLFKGHNLSVVLGQETYNKHREVDTKTYEAFPLDYTSVQAWDSIQNGTMRSSKYFIDMDERMISFFGRVNYDIKDKYLFAATFRADGSSKFTGANRWGYFPSFSAGWRISEEKFMRGTDKVLSNLKLRASYGESGNNRIDNSAFKRIYSSSSSNYLPTSIDPIIYTAGSTMANDKLKWETTITRNAGIDFGFLKDRISGSVEVYSNTTEAVLIKMLIGGVGYTDQWQNAATTANKGLEFTLNAALIQKKDFHLNFSFNISANKNNVVDLGGLSSYSFNEAWTSMSEGSNSYIVKPGDPVGLIYGYVNDGWYSANDFMWNGSKWVMNTGKYTLDSESGLYKDASGNVFVDNSTIAGLSWGPGAMKLKDQNGDGKITDVDRKQIGNTNPVHFGSFSFSGDYKNFDASVNFNWVYGNDIYNANKVELSSLYYRYRNMLGVTRNSYSQIDWTTGQQMTNTAELDQMNANAQIWAAPTGRYVVSSWAMEDGSFLRVNNLTIGYSLPRNILKKLKIEKLRVYGTAYNLYTFTNYSGYDPEVDTRRATPATPGVDYSAYPKSRSYNFGINLTF